jgi:hypothetical protein
MKMLPARRVHSQKDLEHRNQDKGRSTRRDVLKVTVAFLTPLPGTTGEPCTEGDHFGCRKLSITLRVRPGRYRIELSECGLGEKSPH